MPITLLLRPTLAVCCIVATAVSLGGGLVLYFTSLEAVSDAVDRGHIAVEAAVESSMAALRGAVEEARKSLTTVADHGSDADVRLFAGELRQSFVAVEEMVAVTMGRAKVLGRLGTSWEQIHLMGHYLNCGLARAEADRNHGRVSGVGTAAYDPPRRRFIYPFCWWDPGVSLSRDWFATWNNTWEEDGTLYEPYFSIGNGSSYDIPPGAEAWDVESVHWEYPDNLTAEQWLAEGEYWSAPETWWVNEGRIALYLVRTAHFMYDAPPGAPLHGAFGKLEVETDLSHWEPLVADFAARQLAKSGDSELGHFAVVDFAHHLVLAHTTEPAPDMASLPACMEGESTGIGGLGRADSSACFPQVQHYSNTTAFVFNLLYNSSYDSLQQGPACMCGGRMVTCDHDCGNGTEPSNVTFFMRKHHLYTVDDFVLDVLWYRNAAVFQGNVELKERAAEAQAAALRIATAEQSAHSRSEAERSIEQSLYVMIASVCASFLLNAATALGFVVLLAVPLDVLYTCVGLMGEVRCEEAAAEWEARRPCAEVQEIKHVGEGLIVANSVLEEYRSFLPAALLAGLCGADSGSGVSDKETTSNPLAPGKELPRQATTVSSATDPLPSRFIHVSHVSSVGSGGTKGSTSSYSGKRKSTAVPRGDAGRPNRLLGGFNTKRFTILYLNLSGTHQTFADTGSRAAADHITQASATALEVCQQRRGLLHLQLGDRLIVTFDALQDCPGHASKSVFAANRIEAALRDSASACAGISTGLATLGTLGSTCRSLTVIGVNVNKAYACCMAARSVSARVVVSRVTYDASNTEVLYRCVAVWSGEKLGRAVPLFEAVGEHEEGHVEEWMYQLSARESANPYTKYNELVLQHCKALRNTADPSPRGVPQELTPGSDAARLKEDAMVALVPKDAAADQVPQEVALRLAAMFSSAPQHQVNVGIAL